MDSDFAEHLSVEVDAVFLHAVHELAVRRAFLASTCIDAGIP